VAVFGERLWNWRNVWGEFLNCTEVDGSGFRKSDEKCEPPGPRV